MIGMEDKVYWLVMVDYEYEFAEEGKNCIRWQSDLIEVVFEMCVVREEKRWGVLVVVRRHRGMTGISFGVVVVVECLGLFGERHLLSFEV